MPNYAFRESSPSQPPESGLVVQTRLRRARQLVLVGCDELCHHLQTPSCDEGVGRPSTVALVAMVRQVLDRHFDFERRELLEIDFPAMHQVRVRQSLVQNELAKLEERVVNGTAVETRGKAPMALRTMTGEYFDWIDTFFGGDSSGDGDF